MNFEDLDFGRYPFVMHIVEPGDNSLVIDLCGGVVEEISEEERQKRVEAAKDLVGRLLASTNAVLMDESRAYRITFERYVAYQVLNETYCCASPESPVYDNRDFKIYENSDYLEFSKRFSSFEYAKFFNGDEDPRHYSISSTNHIVNVISCKPPMVNPL